MMEASAAKTFQDIAAQLRHEGLLGAGDETVAAALRADGVNYYYAELKGNADANDILAQERAISTENDPISVVFKQKPDVTTVLILPGVYALEVSKTLKQLTAELDDMAQIVGLTARVAKDDSPSELKRSLHGRNSCFVEDRGMLTTGRSVTEAITGAVLLEKAAMTHLLAKKIGGAKRVPFFSAALMHVVYQKKYSRISLAEETSRNRAEASKKADTTDWTERETDLRRQIVDYGKRLTDEGLVQGTWGNLAVRLDETHMLVTPSGLDYHALTAADIVKVELATLGYGNQRKPTSEKRMHRDLFVARADVGAVIHTHARNCGVFAAARKSICCVSDELRELIGDGIRCAPHALPSTKKLSKVALEALEDRNACLLMNHGVICCGKDLRQAYAACKASEQAAKEQLDLQTV
jgi:L-fuculose-phosphate aldolase